LTRKALTRKALDTVLAVHRNFAISVTS